MTSQTTPQIKDRLKSLASILFSIALIVYGITKIALGFFAVFSISPFRDWLMKQSIAKLFITHDVTVAAKFVEVALILFGVYTLLHGASYFAGETNGLKTFITSHHFLYAMYAIIGAALVLFYALVLFTNVPIPKEASEMDHYMLVGFVGGLTFLIMLPFIALTRMWSASQWGVFQMPMFYGMLGLFMVMAAWIVVLTLRTVKKKKPADAESTLIGDSITLMMIPLNMI